MFFRKTELGAASLMQEAGHKRADGTGKVCAHPKALRRRYGLASPPVLSFSLMTTASLCQFVHEAPQSPGDGRRTAGC